jgi:hypothetical protein
MRRDRQMWSAKDFHPMVHRTKRGMTAADLHALKGVASRVTTVKASEVVCAESEL